MIAQWILIIKGRSCWWGGAFLVGGGGGASPVPPLDETLYIYKYACDAGHQTGV